jgi:Zn-dependent protease
MPVTGSSLVIFFISILIAMSVHELMHGLVAYKLGDTTAHEAGRLTLNPLKHIDIITTVLLPVLLVALRLPPFFAAKPVPFNPYRVRWGEYGAALVGLAGPLTNLALAIAGAVGVRLSGVGVGTGVYQVMSMFIQVNIALFIFNMIPFPPLDGSRVLYAFAPEPVQRFMAQIEGMGFSAILIFMFVFFPLLGSIVISLNSELFNLLLG